MTDLEQIEAYIAGLPSPQKEICLALRSCMKQSFPELEEAWKWSRPVYWHKGKYICYFIANQADVNFGFERGAHLSDPKALLKGTGANMRHLKFKTLSDLNLDYASSLVKQAIEMA